MNSKERFEAACNFKKPDRPPIDYLAHYKTDKKLKEYLGVRTEDELLENLGCDFFYLPGRDISQNEGFMRFYKGKKPNVTDRERTCTLGIRWLRSAYDHKFSVDEAIAGPLQDAETEQDILRHSWPRASDFDFSPLQGECEAHSGKVIIGGLWTGIMGDSYRLHGFQNFLMNIALNPGMIRTLINRMTEMYLELNDSIFTLLKGKMDVWFFGNDFGSQNGLLLNPEMWYEFFFDNIKKLTGLAHSYGIKVMMHSCGAISEIIPWLIDAGVDILDPIQVTARGMEPDTLGQKFGGKIVFHGGVDTQQILPNASSDEVVKHALKVIEALNGKGGYIFAPSQLLGSDIPAENIIAMYETARGEKCV